MGRRPVVYRRCDRMTNTRIRTVVSIIKDDDIPANLSDLNAPLYTVKNELLKCTDYDSARAVFRNAKPVNVNTETSGLFVRSVTIGVTYKPIKADNIDIVTFDSDKIYLTENARIIGCTDKAIYAIDKDGKTRQLKRAVSFVMLGN